MKTVIVHKMSIKGWDVIRGDVLSALMADWERVVRFGNGKKASKYDGQEFIAEVTFLKNFRDGSTGGSTYGCDQCTQALLRLIAALEKPHNASQKDGKTERKLHDIDKRTGWHKPDNFDND